MKNSKEKNQSKICLLNLENKLVKSALKTYDGNGIKN
jgi:hypothetical protein